MSGSLKQVPSSSSFLLRVCLDAPELPFPVLGKHRRPLVNRPQRFGIGSIQRPSAVAPCRDQVDAAQYLQVLRHGRLRHLEGVGDVVHRSLLGRNEFEDVPAPWFGDGVEGTRRGRGAGLSRLIYSHGGISQARPRTGPPALTSALTTSGPRR